MTSALISYDDAANLIGDDRSVFLDATFVLPGSDIDPHLVYRNKHIHNARYFDVDEIADPDSHLPHMLPTPELFAEQVGEMGISNETHVIIYGQNGLALGPARAWWMFRVFGHERVHILNGSLQDWETQGYPVETQAPIIPLSAHYQAVFRSELVVDIDEVAKNAQEKSALILDARPYERYCGTGTEPRAGMRSGHIPNSKSLPAGSFINPQTGGLKDKDMLCDLIPKETLSDDVRIIASCGSGVTACVIALAYFELGHRRVSVYDGSWIEWEASNHDISTVI